VKNKNEKDNFFKAYNLRSQDTENNNIKTTNINILLNRVKLDKKKKNKKIILLSIATILSIFLLGILIF